MKRKKEKSEVLRNKRQQGHLVVKKYGVFLLKEGAGVFMQENKGAKTQSQIKIGG